MVMVCLGYGEKMRKIKVWKDGLRAAEERAKEGQSMAVTIYTDSDIVNESLWVEFVEVEKDAKTDRKDTKGGYSELF